jgi:hypothetical protein
MILGQDLYMGIDVTFLYYFLKELLLRLPYKYGLCATYICAIEIVSLN